MSQCWADGRRERLKEGVLRADEILGARLDGASGLPQPSVSRPVARSRIVVEGRIVRVQLLEPVQRLLSGHRCLPEVHSPDARARETRLVRDDTAPREPSSLS
jgi:hypothetical protein